MYTTLLVAAFAQATLGASPEYLKTARSVAECPDGYEKLQSSAECRTACKALGWATDRHGDRDGQHMYPTGCIENGLYCYYNSNTANKPHYQRGVVCRKIQARFSIQPKTGCTGQSTQVSDAAKCRQAAEKLGKRYWGGNGHSSGADPKGCIFRTPDNDVYFNTHATGSLNRGDRKLVCEATEKPTPAPTSAPTVKPTQMPTPAPTMWCEGKQEQSWNYVNAAGNEDMKISFFTPEQITQMRVEVLLGTFNREVHSDINLRIQRDDSYSNSYIKYIRLDTGDYQTFRFKDGYADHTNVQTSNGGRTITCSGNSSKRNYRCEDLPPYKPVDVIITEVYVRPRSGRAHGNQWSRNKFTLTGSKYTVCADEKPAAPCTNET